MIYKAVRFIPYVSFGINIYPVKYANRTFPGVVLNQLFVSKAREKQD